MGDTLDTESFGSVAKTFLDILGSRNTSGGGLKVVRTSCSLRCLCMQLQYCFCFFNSYVPWNLHEEVKGQFNFEGILDIV